MIDIYAAATAVQRFCIERGWKFCFIGGVAFQRWGNPRVTVDADLTLLTGFGGEEKYIDALLQKFSPRREGAREFALHKRVLLLTAPPETPVDIALGAFPFEENSIRRATPWSDSGSDEPLITCSAEDLIVHKAFAARPKDWADVESIIMRQGRKLDVDLIWSELTPLVALKEEPENLQKLQKIFDEQLLD